MKIAITIDEQELKKLIVRELEDKLGEVKVDIKDISIQVKSKQNYKSEWEEAEFKAEFIRHDA